MSPKRTTSGCFWRRTPATTLKKRCGCGKGCSSRLTVNNHTNFSRLILDTRPGSNVCRRRCPKLWHSTIKLKKRRSPSFRRSERLQECRWPISRSASFHLLYRAMENFHGAKEILQNHRGPSPAPAQRLPSKPLISHTA